MNTWIEHITSQYDAPVGLRTQGGIGFIQGKEVVSHFTGHPVHYFESGLWKPITLKRHANGDLEGSPFAFKAGRVTHKGKELFQPNAVIFNGKRYPIQLTWKENRLLCEFPFGIYEVQFRENGVRELLTIPEPVDAVISFDVPHAKKHGLHKKERHIVGTDIFGDEFTITKDMAFPLIIDPDYSANSSDGSVQGDSATYSTARSTSTYFSAGVDFLGIYNYLDGIYYVLRAFLKFDTSGIPDGDSISQVVMKCTVRSVGATAFDVQIVKNDWSGYDPLSSGNRESAFDSVLTSSLDDNIWKNTSGLSTNTQYSSGNLSTSWINKTGYTYYSMQSKNDRDNVAPSTNEQYVQIYSQDSITSGYRPVLTVTHAPQTSKLFALYY